MPETCVKLARSCEHLHSYVRQTRDIYQALLCSVDFKAPGSFEIYRVRQYLVMLFYWE